MEAGDSDVGGAVNPLRVSVMTLKELSEVPGQLL